ncbi:MAG: class I SAM-dependent methyltransferase [Cyclobacteriaceae bacterium]
MGYDSQFINPKINRNNLDRYVIRDGIFKAVCEVLPHFGSKLMDVGCGKMPYKEFILKNSLVSEYVGLDIETSLNYDDNIKPDLLWDGKKIPSDSNSFDTIMVTEVLEHCPVPEIVIDECHRVLKLEGVFFFTVPFIWNLHEIPHDEFRYTPFALKRLLSNAGFKSITIKSPGGWHRSMAQMLGLWVRRSGLNRYQYAALSRLVKPVMNYLINIDQEISEFKEGQMIPSLYGWAKK